jgi:hypothetical protein
MLLANPLSGLSTAGNPHQAGREQERFRTKALKPMNSCWPASMESGALKMLITAPREG